VRGLLDANICILLLIGETPALTARVAECDAGDLAMSTVAFAEVALGSRGGKAPPLNVLEAFVEQIPLVPFDDAAARAYSKLPFRRGSFDRLIAAHAISLGLPLVTANEKDFADIEGLRVENWTR